jgi:hypothetical protein
MVPARRTFIVVISLLSRFVSSRPARFWIVQERAPRTRIFISQKCRKFGPQQIAEAGSVEWLDQHRLKAL